MIHLDTHVMVWLYAGQVERLSKIAEKMLENDELAVSPMAVLEATYLQEIGRTTVSGPDIAADLAGRIGLRVSDAPFGAVVARACALSWTRDPFDRLIAAQAVVEDAPLLTADRTVLEHVPLAVW